MNQPDILEYVYAHAQTTATTGYFSCDPTPLPTVPELLRLLAKRPLDSFLRRHALSRLTGFSGAELASFLKEGATKNGEASGLAALRGLALELALLKPELTQETNFKALLESWQNEKAESPLPYLRLQSTGLQGAGREGRAQNADWNAGRDATTSAAQNAAQNAELAAISAGWAALFKENICNHRALPEPQNAPLPVPPLFEGPKHPPNARNLPELHAEFTRLLDAPLEKREGPNERPDERKSERKDERKNEWEGDSSKLAAFPDTPGSPNLADPAQVAELALQCLQQAGITQEGEMRHQASLSPVGLLRPWKLDRISLCGRNRHTLRGQANTYGRGLGLPEALASCRMEMVERASAYASIGFGPSISPGVSPNISPGASPSISPGVSPNISSDVSPNTSPGASSNILPNASPNDPETAGGKLRVLGLQAASFNFAASDNAAQKSIEAGELVYGSFTALQNQGLNPLDPNSLYLEAPYTDSPLYWLKGQRLTRPAFPGAASGSNNWEEAAFETVLVPVQAVYLFSNLDEADLSFAPPSTGLATFSNMEGAKLAALTELLEREAEATTPFSKQSCFLLESADPQIAALLQDYKARGISVQFQDLSGELGFPCYQAFVTGAKGQVSRGYGAGLSARKAIISALTETPYPYPESAPSGPALRKLQVKNLEDLPDYSITDGNGNLDRKASLALLESLFYENGLPPVYVELTRADLKFPVIRAIVPGLVPTAEYDEYSPIPARLYKNYLRLFDLAL